MHAEVDATDIWLDSELREEEDRAECTDVIAEGGVRLEE